MMMLVLAHECGCIYTALVRSTLDTGALELSGLLLETTVDVLVATVDILTVLDGKDVLLVLLGQDLPVLDRLNGCVVVILVNFLVDDRNDLLALLPFYSLLYNGRVDLFVDGSIMMT